MNAFEDLFGSIFHTNINPDINVNIMCLNDYWKHGKIKEYYNLVNNLKRNGYCVLRNKQGLHKVETYENKK